MKLKKQERTTHHFLLLTGAALTNRGKRKVVVTGGGEKERHQTRRRKSPIFIPKSTDTAVTKEEEGEHVVGKGKEAGGKDSPELKGAGEGPSNSRRKKGLLASRREEESTGGQRGTGPYSFRKKKILLFLCKLPT